MTEAQALSIAVAVSLLVIGGLIGACRAHLRDLERRVRRLERNDAQF